MPMFFREASDGGAGVFREHGLDIAEAMPSSQLGDELSKKLKSMREKEVVDITDPYSAKIKIIGKNGVGVIAADNIVVQIERNEARVFVSKSAVPLSLRQTAPRDHLSDQQLYDAILSSPKLSKAFFYIPQIFDALSESGIKITEIKIQNTPELTENTEQSMWNTWLSLRGENPLIKGICKKIGAMKENMIDEKIGKIKFVGWGSVMAMKLDDELAVEMREKTATVLMSPNFASYLKDYSKKQNEVFKIFQGKGLDSYNHLITRYPLLLEGEEKFSNYVAVIASLKLAGVKQFIFRETGSNFDVYPQRTRDKFRIPKILKDELDAGASLADAVNKVLEKEHLTKFDLIKSLEEAGASSYSQIVQEHFDALKYSKERVSRLLDDFVARNAVPPKEELLERLKSGQISQSMLEEEIAEMQGIVKGARNRIQSYDKQLKARGDLQPNKEYLAEIKNEDQAIIDSTENKIKKAEKALEILRGS